MLTKSRDYYRPFQFPWAFDVYKKQSRMVWFPDEVNMTLDIADWNHKLTPKEKNLLTQLFRFFTQQDISVGGGYRNIWGPMFGGQPEVAMMLTSFQFAEAIHTEAYAYLIDTLGLPESDYSAFLKYKEMRDKHEYLSQNTRQGYIGDAITLAKYSAFAEGMQLFSSFVILLNFSRFGLMKGMGQIVTWSIKDEQNHVDAMIKLFHQFVNENDLDKGEIENRIIPIAKKMVELEDKFIDLMWEVGEARGLKKEDVKKYIRYIADIRMKQLGFRPLFYVTEHPLDWVEWIVSGVEHQNFFEGRATEYSKPALSGSWDDAFI